MFLIKHVQQLLFAQELEKLEKGLPNSLPKSIPSSSQFIHGVALLKLGGWKPNFKVDFFIKHTSLYPRTH